MRLHMQTIVVEFLRRLSLRHHRPNLASCSSTRHDQNDGTNKLHSVDTVTLTPGGATDYARLRTWLLRSLLTT